MVDNHKYTEFLRASAYLSACARYFRTLYQTRKTTVTRPLSQASQYATFLLAVHPSTSSRVFFKHWAFIANRQFASQAFIFSVHETGTTHFHHPVRCQQWLSIARHSRSRNCLCTAHARQGGNSVWQMREYVFSWRLPSPSHFYFEICINYFVICMIYELSSARV